ncbi:DUF559 domain-containing protein [Marinilabiliaceae bacterium JC017]|nr:DUF559 domain-containing protein [Marinilabiliaceae bacterium JC017]
MLENLGLTVLRFTNEELVDMERVLEEIQNTFSDY